MKNLFFILSAMLFMVYNTTLYAQEQLKITGKVVTKDGEALIGADVRENGTENFTTTDVDGNFTLYVSSKDAIVKISSVGFKDTYIPADRDFSKVIVYKFYKERPYHMNIGYSQGEIEPSSDSKYLAARNIKSMVGFNINGGGTYFFNKKPGLRPIRTGIIFDFLNINYNMYEEDDFYMHQDNYEFTIDEAKFGVGIGPSVVFSPARKLNIQASAKYLPSFSLLSFDSTGGDLSEFKGFSNGFSFGVGVSYDCLGFGVEYFMDSVKYKELDDNTSYISDSADKTPISHVLGVRDGKIKSSGIRAFVTFKIASKKNK